MNEDRQELLWWVRFFAILGVGLFVSLSTIALALDDMGLAQYHLIVVLVYGAVWPVYVLRRTFGWFSDPRHFNVVGAVISQAAGWSLFGVLIALWKRNRRSHRQRPKD